MYIYIYMQRPEKRTKKQYGGGEGIRHFETKLIGIIFFRSCRNFVSNRICFFFFYISKFSLHLRFTLLMKKDFIYIYIIYQKNVHLIKRTISIFREKSILKMLVP